MTPALEFGVFPLIRGGVTECEMSTGLPLPEPSLHSSFGMERPLGHRQNDVGVLRFKE